MVVGIVVVWMGIGMVVVGIVVIGMVVVVIVVSGSWKTSSGDSGSNNESGCGGC